MFSNYKSDGTTRVFWGSAIAAFWALVALTASLPLDLPSNQDWSMTSFVPDTGSTAWILVCAIMGFCIGPFFAYFWATYRGADVVKALKMAATTSAVVTMMWILFTYSLVWGEDAHDNGILGFPKTYYMFHDTNGAPNPNAPAIPSTIFAMFELAFAILTPTILGMYMLERINLKGWIWFTLVWHMVVWCPVAHITWGSNGFLRDRSNGSHHWHIIDFSGGIVVNICAAAAMVAGKNWWNLKNGVLYQVKNVTDGAASWGSFIYVFFLWFAINAGKAHQANAVAAQSITNTFAGVMASWFTCILVEIYTNGHLNDFSYTQLVNSGLIALVSLTPSSGYVTVGGAMVITVVSNIATKFANLYANSNDPEGALANSKPICALILHGFTGTLGFLLTAVLSYKFINNEGQNGLTYGVGETLAYHICAVVVLWPMIWFGSFLCFWVCDKMSELSEGISGAAVPTSEPKV